MAWQPEQEPLRQLSRCLRDSLSGHNKNAQKQAEIMLAQAKSSPDINNYLTYLFSNSQVPSGLVYTQDEYHSVRAAAAIMLKNNIKTGYKTIPPESLALVRASIPLALQDKSLPIRSYAGNVITEIVNQGGILGWPQVLSDLIALVGNDSGTVTPEAQEGAMSALAKICEDNKKSLDKDYQGQRPLTVIIPKLIEFTSNDKYKIRSLALGTINVFVPQKSQAILACLDNLLNRLFQLANDPAADVRRQVCRAFVQIIEIRPDKILPHLSGLVDYIITQQRKVEDEDLACDAAEFWLTVGEHEELWKSLSPYLSKIIPVLLESMVYSEDDILMLEGGGNDADEEDRAEDIKPTFAKSKGARVMANGEIDENGQNGDSYTKLNNMDDDDLDEGEIEEFGSDDDDEVPEVWNLRKCSAAALDVFATDFRGPVFDTILPYLLTNLKHSEWPYREAAVLAFGAIAEGCIDAITPHLPELVPYLISLLSDEEPLVRQITCWTLGRYSAWGAGLTDPRQRSQYFEPMMEGILLRMLDPNKGVQEAGASAFAHLEEKAGVHLTPYCEPIIGQFVRCFDKYKDRNMFILYDCVQTLAEHVGHGLAQPQLIDMLMPALIHRWHKVSDQSRELFPLLECLSYVAAALAESFAPFAAPVFSRCINIIHQNLEEYLGVANPSSILDPPDKDFLVTSLDLLSAIVQAVDEKQSAELVSGSRPQLFELLGFCVEDPENDVRQSSYALLGDCAKYVFPHLQPFLPTLLPPLLRQLDLDAILDEQIVTGFSVVNNACWSAGEIALQNSKQLEPYVGDLLGRFLEILGNPEVPKSVLENAAIALGRLGLYNFQIMAPHLATFAEPFLKSIETVDFTLEKATACKGFTLCVAHNPQAMEKDLTRFLIMVARYKMDDVTKTPVTADLKHIFTETLGIYKTIIPDVNTYLTNNIPPVELNNIRLTYGM